MPLNRYKHRTADSETAALFICATGTNLVLAAGLEPASPCGQNVRSVWANPIHTTRANLGTAPGIEPGCVSFRKRAPYPFGLRGQNLVAGTGDNPVFSDRESDDLISVVEPAGIPTVIRTPICRVEA